MKKFIITGLAVVSVSFSGMTFANDIETNLTSNVTSALNDIATRKAKEMLDAEIAALPEPFSAMVSYDDVSINLATETMTINNINVTEVGNIEKVVLVGNLKTGVTEIPENIDISIANLSLKGSFAQLLLMDAPAALQNTTYNISSKWNYNPDKNTANINSNITADNIASLSFNSIISDMSAAAAVVQTSANKDQIEISEELDKALNQMKIGSIAMSITNKGNLKTLANQILKQNNTTNEELIAFFNKGLEEETEEANKEVIRSFIGFISNWNQFELSASFPNGGMTIKEIEYLLDDRETAQLFKEINLQTSGN